MKKILLIILTFSLLSCNHTDNEVQLLDKKTSSFNICGDLYSLKDFKQIDIPNYQTEKWLELNHSAPVAVTFYKNRLFFHEYSCYARQHIELNDGYIRGVDNGEFGGGLYYIPFNIELEKQELYSGNISQIFEYKKNIFAFAGGGHLISDAKGLLLKITKEKGIYKAEKMLELNCRPEAMIIHNDMLLIAGHNKFIIIKDFIIKTIIEDAFWYGLRPNSVTVDNKNIVYVGMRGGYVTLNLTTKKMQYFRLYDKEE